MIKLLRTFDRSISGSIWKQLLWLIISLVVTFFIWMLLSYLLFGDILFPDLQDEVKSPLNSSVESNVWAIISLLFDPGNMQYAIPQIRVFALLIAFSGSILLSGMLISTFSNSMERRVDKIKSGQVNYKFKDHYVIIGYNDMVPALIKQLVTNQESVPDIVLHTSQFAPDVRRKLNTRLSTSMERRVTVLFGGRDTYEEMQRLQVYRAKEIFIMGEGEELINDSLNVECLNIISKSIKENNPGKRIQCRVLFHSPTTFSAFQFLDLPEAIAKNIDLIPYNFQELWAQQVLCQRKLADFSADEKIIQYKPLDYSTITIDSSYTVHLIVAGFSLMGSALVVETIRLAHFANGKKTRITIIDSEATREKNSFTAKFPFYDHIGDIEISFVQGDMEMEDIRKKMNSWANEENVLTTIAICYDDPVRSLNTALNLPAEIYFHEIPILVRQEISYSIISLLSSPKKGFNKFRNVKPFGMTDLCFDIANDRDRKAKAVNYFYSNNFQLGKEIDTSELEKFWNPISISDKWSNRYNADSFSFKLRALKLSGVVESEYPVKPFSDSDIEVLAEMEHARWNAERVLAGYRPPNRQELSKSKKMDDAEFDNYKKELQKLMVHLCIVPYKNLREKYKEYDRILVKTIPLIENSFGDHSPKS